VAGRVTDARCGSLLVDLTANRSHELRIGDGSRSGCSFQNEIWTQPNSSELCGVCRFRDYTRRSLTSGSVTYLNQRSQEYFPFTEGFDVSLGFKYFKPNCFTNLLYMPKRKKGAAHCPTNNAQSCFPHILRIADVATEPPARARNALDGSWEVCRSILAVRSSSRGPRAFTVSPD